jgi:DNA-binding phage protein
VAVSSRFKHVEHLLDERTRRVLAAAEAKVAGRGGIDAVARATGVARRTVQRGLLELGEAASSVEVVPGRIRRPGGGRKRADAKDPELLPALERLVAPATRGDPMSPLRWTSKSTDRLARELTAQGHPVGARTVARLLEQLGFSLQANQKSLEGRSSNPDRNAQFEFINLQASQRLQEREPVISVDTKKKELIGDFGNGGREYQPKGSPESVNVHDFITDSQGRATPYGVYDVGDNSGWVSVGTDHDTAAFAVETIRRWWQSMGTVAYPNATKLMITADCGGSNGARLRLWKMELQRFADELAMPITVCHFPPGTSKWNKIEHRLFSHITMNWRGKPLVSHEAMVQLIANTTTKTGLKVKAALDTGSYPKGRSVSKREMKDLNMQMIGPHEGWAYTISPRPQNRAS